MRITRRLSRSATAVVATVATAAVLTACGGGDGTAAQPAANASFNLADVGFAQMMIPHHSQAVKMATLAATRAKDPKVQKLAAEILAAQGPEIETMQTLLEAWAQPLIPDMADMDHSSMTPDEITAMMSGSMPGMAKEPELEKLSTAKGAAFDRLFLTLMLGHHRGAVEMAQMERADGKAVDALALAEDIETGQTAEIMRMEKLQKAS
ncbi:MAG: DUF305 domain-containing protein [Sporichthyaceae bacterium]